jgi:hypothetical protein
VAHRLHSAEADLGLAEIRPAAAATTAGPTGPPDLKLPAGAAMTAAPTERRTWSSLVYYSYEAANAAKIADQRSVGGGGDDGGPNGAGEDWLMGGSSLLSA